MPVTAHPVTARAARVLLATMALLPGQALAQSFAPELVGPRPAIALPPHQRMAPLDVRLRIVSGCYLATRNDGTITVRCPRKPLAVTVLSDSDPDFAQTIEMPSGTEARIPPLQVVLTTALRLNVDF